MLRSAARVIGRQRRLNADGFLPSPFGRGAGERAGGSTCPAAYFFVTFASALLPVASLYRSTYSSNSFRIERPIFT